MAYLRRTSLSGLFLLFAACSETDPAAEDPAVEGASLPLLGSDIKAPPDIIVRNAIQWQKFEPATLTPDGRLGVTFRTGPIDPKTGELDSASEIEFVALGDPTLSVVTVGPPPPLETKGVPVAGPIPWSAPSARFKLEFEVVPALNHLVRASLLPGVPVHTWPNSGSTSLALDPRFSVAGKPVPVNDPNACKAMTVANREALTDPAGRFDCYRLIHYLGAMQETTQVVPNFQMSYAIVLDARRPDTRSGVPARVSPPQIVDAGTMTFQGTQEVFSKPDVVRPYRLMRGAYSSFIQGLEQSATADGRLLLSQGPYFAFNETPWRYDTWSLQRHVNRFRTDMEQSLDGLKPTVCRRVDANNNAACPGGAGAEAMAHVYPVTAWPLHYADGEPWLDQTCFYTWISPEGTDIFCRPETTDGLMIGASNENGPTVQFFAAGQHTNWMWRRLDSTFNTRRFNPDRTLPCTWPDYEDCRVDFYGGPPVATGKFEKYKVQRPFSPIFLNTSTGFWASNRNLTETALPIQRQWPLFQFFVQNHSLKTRAAELTATGLTVAPTQNMQYAEVSFACGVSPNCLLHLPMNESRYDTAAYDANVARRALKKTDDNSNNTDFPGGSSNALTTLQPYSGELSPDARFIGEVYGEQKDEWYLSGFRGTGISLPATGSVTVNKRAIDVPCQRNKGCLTDPLRDGFTAELAILPLVQLQDANMLVAEQFGIWWMQLDKYVPRIAAYYTLGSENDAVVHRVIMEAPAGVPFAPLTDTPARQASRWTHFALRASPREKQIQAYFNGRPVNLKVDGITYYQGYPIPSDAHFKASPVGNKLIAVGPAGGCAGCPSGDVLFVDELRFHDKALPAEDIAASAGVSTGRSDFMSASEAYALIAGYFNGLTPRTLTLDANGFPTFLNAADLRVPKALAPYAAPATFRKIVDVGRQLFSSPLLSLNAAGVSQVQRGTNAPMTCATCHDPTRSFTDGNKRAVGVNDDPTAMNVPTIINRALGTNQFFARRSKDILEQALVPIENPTEMNGNLAKILDVINFRPAGAAMKSAIVDAFGPLSYVTSTHLKVALAAFQLVQLAADSRVEAVLATGKSLPDGLGGTLDPTLVRLGKDLFEGKARCSACHTGPNFSDELAHDTNVEAAPIAVKTPTLWNIAFTGPYFHDGQTDTLRKVLDHYNGGGNGFRQVKGGLKVIDPEMRPLGLTSRELDALEAYLRGLQNVGAVASSLPMIAFSNHGRIPGYQTCVAVNPGVAGWENDFVCTKTDIGLTYLPSSKVPNLKYVKIDEPLDLTVRNSYLCLPLNSPYTLSYSLSGPISGKTCTQFFASQYGVGWADNYLCY
jgi:cytochrome c peroxidase